MAGSRSLRIANARRKAVRELERNNSLPWRIYKLFVELASLALLVIFAGLAVLVVLIITGVLK